MSTINEIPCKYIVAKYVDDEIRDEPVNIGIILQSQRNFRTTMRFATETPNWKLKNVSNESNFLLREMIKKLKEYADSYEKDQSFFEKMSSSYDGKIRFTSPRGTLASDLLNKTNSLFELFVTSYRPVSESQTTHEKIAYDVWEFMRNISNKVIRREHLIRGLVGKFRFDIVLIDSANLVSYVFQAISFQQRQAIDRLKLFDWAAKDTIQKDKNLVENNFTTIISQPNKQSDPGWEYYLEGKEILSSRGYEWFEYDKEESWKSKLKEIVA